MPETTAVKTTNERARAAWGRRAGYLGIALNVLLAAGKIAFGAMAGAVSAVADGLNNLTDCGSNAVAVVGFKVSAKPADKEHPYGHRRAESVAALVIAVVILAVAAELAVQSIERIFSAAETDFSAGLAIVLGVSVAVKVFLFLFNRRLWRRYAAETFKATATDSLSDAVATAAVLLCLFLSKWTGVNLDGYMGVAVAAFIAVSGGAILKETVSRLMGRAADAQTVRALKERVCAFDGVRGVHDVMLHDYGGKLYATVHVEVDEGMALTAAHDLADAIEKSFAADEGIDMTVHIDPLVYGDPKVEHCRALTERIVAGIGEGLRVHDFRMVGGEAHANLVFEVAVPFDFPLPDAEILARIRDGFALSGENLDPVAAVERQNDG